MKLQHLYERRHKPAKQKDSTITDTTSDNGQGLDADPFAFGPDDASVPNTVDNSVPSTNIDPTTDSGVAQDPATPATQTDVDNVPQTTSKVDVPKQVKKAMSAMSDIKSNDESEQKELAGDCYDLLQHLIDMGDHEGMISFAEIALHLVDADLQPTSKSAVPPVVGK